MPHNVTPSEIRTNAALVREIARKIENDMRCIVARHERFVNMGTCPWLAFVSARLQGDADAVRPSELTFFESRLVEGVRVELRDIVTRNEIWFRRFPELERYRALLLETASPA